MSLINFTVKYDLFAAQNDLADADANNDLNPMIGSVIFTPLFTDERAVLAPNYDPHPSGFKFLPISGYLDSDGQLKNAPSGTVGLRLPAKDPVLGLGQLVYQVDFNVRTSSGEKIVVDGGYIYAPDSDQTVHLAESLQTGDAIGGPALISGIFVGETVIFENSDNTFLEPITIPNGVLVFVDNSDSTWSVG